MVACNSKTNGLLYRILFLYSFLLDYIHYLFDFKYVNLLRKFT